jgi:hypothetical protein
MPNDVRAVAGIGGWGFMTDTVKYSQNKVNRKSARQPGFAEVTWGVIFRQRSMARITGGKVPHPQIFCP